MDPLIYKDLKKFTLREEQKKAIEFVKKVYEKTDKKFILLNLPTGVGKSILAIQIAQLFLENNKYSNKKVDIITAGKLLQDQYSDTFECINNLKGKDNYECGEYECSCLHGKEFARLNKTKCESCPYDNSKIMYMNGDISLTNFHLYLINNIYNPDSMKNRNSKLLIVDEAHLFDDTISSFFALKFNENIIKKLKLPNEEDLIKEFLKVKNVENYISFIKKFNSEIIDTCISMEGNYGINDVKNATMSLNFMKVFNHMSDKKHVTNEVAIMKLVSEYKNLMSKIDIFLKEYEENPNNWVLEKVKNDKSLDILIEPIWTGNYLEKYIWSRYDNIVLMSGTILDKNIFGEINGINGNDSIYYSIDSPFPVQNRPIYYIPLGKMTYNSKSVTIENYKKWIPKILDKYKNDKGIIHTNSFELAEWIINGVSTNRFIIHDSTNKDEMLKEHFDTNKPSVIVSPSMGTGVSFDYDKSRFQIIAKIPYPSLASEKNKLRQKQSKSWYSLATVQNLLQAIGRNCRSLDDWGHTIIIDESFSDILRYNLSYIPNWIQDSIKQVNIKNN